MPAPTPTPAKRRRLTADEARLRILEAAERRLAEGGPEGIRLQDLARDLGIAHPTILHHFGSREGLMRALEDHAMTGLQAALLQADRAGDTLDLVHRTLIDRGHARLLAWMALSRPDLADGDAEERMLETLATALHGERQATSAEPLDPEESVFAVRLIATAMVGEALLGPLFSRSAGRADDADLPRRFRLWLGRLLERGGLGEAG